LQLSSCRAVVRKGHDTGKVVAGDAIDSPAFPDRLITTRIARAHDWLWRMHLLLSRLADTGYSLPEADFRLAFLQHMETKPLADECAGLNASHTVEAGVQPWAENRQTTDPWDHAEDRPSDSRLCRDANVNHPIACDNKKKNL